MRHLVVHIGVSVEKLKSGKPDDIAMSAVIAAPFGLAIDPIAVVGKSYRRAVSEVK
jgi:hypothetical protein